MALGKDHLEWIEMEDRYKSRIAELEAEVERFRACVEEWKLVAGERLGRIVELEACVVQLRDTNELNPVVEEQKRVIAELEAENETLNGLTEDMQERVDKYEKIIRRLKAEVERLHKMTLPRNHTEELLVGHVQADRAEMIKEIEGLRSILRTVIAAAESARFELGDVPEAGEQNEAERPDYARLLKAAEVEVERLKGALREIGDLPMMHPADAENVRRAVSAGQGVT